MVPMLMELSDFAVGVLPHFSTAIYICAPLPHEKIGREAPSVEYDGRRDNNTTGASMKNVELSIKGEILTITVDLSKDFGPSSSGKAIIIASTEGNYTLPDRDEKIGLNVYKKPG